MNEESGYILAFSLILFALVAIMIGPLLDLMSSGLKQGSAMLSSTNQLYIADAGVESACQNILTMDLPGWVSENNSYSYSFPAIENLTEDGSRVQVAISYNPATDFTSQGLVYHVVSTGTDANGGTTTITTKILSSHIPGGFITNALTTSGNINMSGAALCNGNVYAGGNITLSGSADINGDVTASGTLTGVTGTSGAPQVSDSFAPDLNATVQTVYDETFTGVATPAPQGTPVSTMTVQNNGSNSNYYHYTNPIYVNGSGNLTFSNVNYVVFDCPVYVVGNINFSSGVQNIIFSGSVYVGGTISSSGSLNITFNNTLTAGSINLGGSGTFTFNGGVKDLGNLTVGNSISTSFGSTIYIGGDLSYGGAGNLNINSDIYINGALILGNSAQIVGPEKVVVRGDSAQTYEVSISGAGSFTNTSQLPFIIVPPGSTIPALSPATDPTAITVTGSGHASAVIYAPTAAFTISGAGILNGAIFSKSATLSNSARVDYPSDLDQRTDLPGSNNGISIETWGIT